MVDNYCPVYPLITRPIDRVFIHCSASDNPKHDDVTVIDRWHRARGFDMVGYHHFIKKNGIIQNGRPLDRVPAAQAPHNTGTIAICLHGLKEENFTTAQASSLYKICRAIDESYDVTFHGHKEVANKACPVIDYIGILRLDERGNMVYA